MSPVPTVSNPLRGHARRIYSQNEDDGILESIFNRLGTSRGFCVDVGAHDGFYLSNTANLIQHHGWSGLLVECDPLRFGKLVENMRGIDRVKCVNTCVAFSGADTLDNIMAAADAPAQFDLLSIDVDGLDYHIWESLRDHRPTVVIVEYNPSIPNQVSYVQPRDPGTSHGNSIRALAELGKVKGYLPVYATATNLILVNGLEASRLEILDHSLDALRDDRALTTYLFQGFDGTLLLDGPQELYWQHLPIDPEQIQVVPRFLRRYPGSLPVGLRFARYAWVAWYLIRRPRHWPVLLDKVKRWRTNTPPPERPF
jgi:hypothetical protein